MKRSIILFLSIAITLIFSACDKPQKEYELGFGYVPSLKKSENGSIDFSAVIAAVVTDEKGIITACEIDAIQNKVNIDNGIIDPLAYGNSFLTKRELAELYGMKAASSINKEWYEQAEYFSEYVIGKTLGQVSAIHTKNRSDGGKIAADEVIKSGCTIDVSDFIKAITEAGTDRKAKSFKSDNYRVCLASISSFNTTSKNARQGQEGAAGFKNVFCALAVDGNNKILAAIVDRAEPEINFNYNGSIDGIDSDKFKSNREKEYIYDMRSVSNIKKEWFEQTAFLEEYLIGANAVGANSINKSVIRAGCTIDISDFLKCIRKAFSLDN